MIACMDGFKCEGAVERKSQSQTRLMQRFFTLKKLVPTSPILGSVLANSTRTSFNMAWRSHGISNKNMVDVLNSE